MKKVAKGLTKGAQSVKIGWSVGICGAIIEYERTVSLPRKGFNREEGNRFAELPRCLRNRKNALLLFTAKNGKEGGRYAMKWIFRLPKRYKPGDLPCVLVTDFLRRGGKGVDDNRLSSGGFYLSFYPNAFVCSGFSLYFYIGGFV